MALITQEQLTDEKDIIEHLTAIATDVLTLISFGYTAKDIAKRLGKSRKTIEWHRSQLGQKFSIRSNVELARIAIRHGVAPVDLVHPKLITT